VRSIVAASPRRRRRSRGGSRGSRAGGSWWRSGPARAGCLCARRCARRVPCRVSPSPLRRARWGASSAARRLIARTPAGFARCCARRGCPRPGSRRHVREWRTRGGLRKPLVDGALGLAGASPGDALPRRRGRRAGQAAERRGARVPGSGGAGGGGARAGRGWASSERGARPPASAARVGAAPARPPPARLPGAGCATTAAAS
jgi:hypothetical protein